VFSPKGLPFRLEKRKGLLPAFPFLPLGPFNGNPLCLRGLEDTNEGREEDGEPRKGTIGEDGVIKTVSFKGRKLGKERKGLSVALLSIQEILFA